MLRAAFQNGRFGVTFDDNLAFRSAMNTPSRTGCPKVARTQDLRTMLVTGVALQTNGPALRLTREGKSGEYAVTDAWLYATKTGSIRGECSAPNASARYNLSLRQGWNVIRIYVSDKQPLSVVQNVTGQVMPWMIR